jgi:hypothetical protein
MIILLDMSRFTSITSAAATITDLNVDNIRPSNKTRVNLLSDIEMNYNNIKNVKSINLNNTIDLIYDSNKNTAAIKLTGTNYKGVIYDNTFNRPYEQVLPITQEYIIPDNNVELIRSIVQQPSRIYLVNPASGNQTFDIPALQPIIEYQNTHLRFSNTNLSNLINFTYKGENIIQIGYERASFIWYTADGTNYAWKYVT